MAEARVVAIVGAESTGKTELAQDLAARLKQATGARVTWVGEWLRAWCDTHGRTPRPEEQAEIAGTQQAHIEAAAARHDIVVADTTPLMTAVYSELLFRDASLTPQALVHQQGYGATLLTALDLPWVADGLQRDGPQVRAPVDDRIRQLLARHGVPWSVVAGRGEARVQSALAALQPVLGLTPAPGLFTRLLRDGAPLARWQCDCDSPGCEALSLRLRRGG